MRGLTVSHLPDGRKAVIIRTSDRATFKQCRRKWGFSSHLKMNLGPKELSPYLWFGSGFHYALEDFHGYNKFGQASEAFTAFCVATAKNYLRELPADAKELLELGRAMLDYYQQDWLQGAMRQAHKTYWDNGAPQVEVNFEIPIPIDEFPCLAEYCRRQSIDTVLYRGTWDAIAVDEWGNLWVVEYKTAKRAEHMHYQTDPQVSTYVWAAQQIYNRPVAGVIYYQFVKLFPQSPRILSCGKVSTASNLSTSVPLYTRALTSLYGKPDLAPAENVEFLKGLHRSETADADRYVIRERVHRSDMQAQNQAQLILLELEDMLNPDLPLYPNPTRDCSRFCSFISPCVAMDAGHDWEAELEMQYTPRDQDPDRLWRRRLPPPQQLAAITARGELPDLHAIQARAISDEQRRRAELAATELTGETFSMGVPQDITDQPFSFDMSQIRTHG